MEHQPGQDVMADIEAILGRPPEKIVDVGCHYGGTTVAYLRRFPNCHVTAFEAEPRNYAIAWEAFGSYADRVDLRWAAVSDQTGSVDLHINAHHATHSLLPIGDVRYWGEHVDEMAIEMVPTVRLDDVIAGARDLLHMDIQGGEMKALQGARGLLSERAIHLIYLEVEFYTLYQGQPLFWDIGQYLSNHGYHFYSLYGVVHHPANPSVVPWADALFVSDTLLQMP